MSRTAINNRKDQKPINKRKMEGDFRSKIKKQSERTKYKSKRTKKAPGFAIDFTYYSKVLKANQNNKKSLLGQTNSKNRKKEKLQGLGSMGKGRTNREGKPQEFVKRHRRNIHSHNQYTLQGLNFGASKNQILSPKNQARNAFTARSNHTGELKKFKGGKKTSVAATKNQYFIDSQIKKNRSPDLMRQKKGVTDSLMKKKLAKERKRRKTKTCTEGQLQRVKIQAEGMLRSKLKHSQMVNRSKATNYQGSTNSSKVQNNQKLRRKEKRSITSSNNSISRKKLADRKNKKGSPGRAKELNFDLTIPLPQNVSSGELEITQEESENPGLRGPYISCRNSQQVSRRSSPVGNKMKPRMYRKELDRGSPLKKLEQTGMTLGSNYASITSKNYKNDSLNSQTNKGPSKGSLKGYSHNRNFSYQYSHPLKNSSQFSQRVPKTLFHKQSTGDSAHQSYASIQPANPRTEQKKLLKNKKRMLGAQGHRKNLSSNFGHSPFLKNPKLK